MTRFAPMERPTGSRILAAALWSAPNDPTLLAAVDIDFTAARAFVERYEALFGVALTPTHLVGRATGLMLARHPEVNARVGVARIWLRRAADLSFIVAAGDGRSVTSTKVEAADQVALSALAERLRTETAEIRAGHDRVYGKGLARLRRLPIWLARPLLRAGGWSNIHLGRPAPADAHGGAIITAIGMFGFDTAFSALMPYSGCGLVIAVMEVRERPWVADGAVLPRPVLRLCFSADHRLIDGEAGAGAIDTLRALLSAPEALLTEAEQTRWDAAAR